MAEGALGEGTRARSHSAVDEAEDRPERDVLRQREADRGVARRLGRDILAEPPQLETMLGNLRAERQERAVGDAVVDQRLVAGIGNLWKAEALWAARVSPWTPLADVSDDELRDVLREANDNM